MTPALLYPIARGQKRPSESELPNSKVESVTAGSILARLKENFIDDPLNKKCGALTSNLFKFFRKNKSIYWGYAPEEIHRITCIYSDWTMKGIYKTNTISIKNITRLTMRCTVQFYIALKDGSRIKACRKKARLDPRGHIHFEPAFKLQKDIILFLREAHKSHNKS